MVLISHQQIPWQIYKFWEALLSQGLQARKAASIHSWPSYAPGWAWPGPSPLLHISPIQGLGLEVALEWDERRLLPLFFILTQRRGEAPFPQPGWEMIGDIPLKITPMKSLIQRSFVNELFCPKCNLYFGIHGLASTCNTYTLITRDPLDDLTLFFSPTSSY